MRAGFTLIELLVAIMVLTVGVLSLAATAGFVAARLADGGTLTDAAHVATSTLDSLRACRCESLTNGSARLAMKTVSWTVRRDSAAAEVTVTVVTPLRRGQGAHQYQAVVPCPVP